MDREPQIQQRPAQRYAGIRMPVTMASFPGAADRSFPELFGWLAERGVAAAGPPFIRFHVVDMEGELDIEFAVPVGEEIKAGERVRCDVLPAGRYLTLRHVGPYDGLIASNAALQRWADEHGVVFDIWDTGRGSAWRGRVEHYLTNPSAEPDPAKWEVDISYLIAPAPSG